MAIRKNKDVEDKLTDENLEKVIAMLDTTNPSVKPWTKKDCCAFLGIAYNTTRLASIIKEYTEKVLYKKERKAAKLGKPVTSDEVAFIIQSYIEGESLESIAESIFRGTSAVKTVLSNSGVPTRPTSHDYFKPELIPDRSAKERFAIGEVVYSAKYNVNAEIKAEQVHPVHGFVYRVWLLGEEQQFAYTPAYELASLEHLRELGVRV